MSLKKVRMDSLADKLYGQPEPVKVTARRARKDREENAEKKSKDKKVKRSEKADAVKEKKKGRSKLSVKENK